MSTIKCDLRILFGGVLTIFLFAGCGLDETMTRIDKPTSPTEIRNLFNVALPKSAKDMYFAAHTELNGLEEYVRFEVAPDEIDEAIQAVMRYDSKGRNDISFYEKKPIRADLFAKPSSCFGGISWWNLDSIKNGYLYVKKDHTRIFWIDTDRNIVYLLWTA